MNLLQVQLRIFIKLTFRHKNMLYAIVINYEKEYSIYCFNRKIQLFPT